MINHFKRYQAGLTLNDIYPKVDGYCACGCNMPLIKPSKKWFSKKCRDNSFINFSIIKGDNYIIREQLFIRDQGACKLCGEITEKWEADHIIPVSKGGGGKGLNNFQTLCKYCHAKKTNYKLSHQSAISSQAVAILFNRNLIAVGADIAFSLKTSKEIHCFNATASPFLIP